MRCLETCGTRGSACVQTDMLIVCVSVDSYKSIGIMNLFLSDSSDFYRNHTSEILPSSHFLNKNKDRSFACSTEHLVYVYVYVF